MKCSNCGNPLDNNSSFCGNCGANNTNQQNVPGGPQLNSNANTNEFPKNKKGFPIVAIIVIGIIVLVGAVFIFGGKDGASKEKGNDKKGDSNNTKYNITMEQAPASKSPNGIERNYAYSEMYGGLENSSMLVPNSFSMSFKEAGYSIDINPEKKPNIVFSNLSTFVNNPGSSKARLTIQQISYILFNGQKQYCNGDIRNNQYPTAYNEVDKYLGFSIVSSSSYPNHVALPGSELVYDRLAFCKKIGDSSYGGDKEDTVYFLDNIKLVKGASEDKVITVDPKYLDVYVNEQLSIDLSKGFIMGWRSYSPNSGRTTGTVNIPDKVPGNEVNLSLMYGARTIDIVELKNYDFYEGRIIKDIEVNGIVFKVRYSDGNDEYVKVTGYYTSQIYFEGIENTVWKIGYDSSIESETTIRELINILFESGVLVKK